LGEQGICFFKYFHYFLINGFWFTVENKMGNMNANRKGTGLKFTGKWKLPMEGSSSPGGSSRTPGI
jgi:hypothetical protein